MPAQQFRAAVITDHRAEDYVDLPEGVQFIAWSIETAPTTGKLHCQAYAYGRKQTVKAWNKAFCGAHIEQMRGTFAQNDTYCSKESTLKTLGVKPQGTGQRRDLAAIQQVLDTIPPGQCVMDIAKDPDNFNVCIQFRKGLEAYVSNKRRRDVETDYTAPDVILITGPPGVGKTRYVIEREPGYYRVPHPVWRDGYDMQEAVLYNNYTPKTIMDRTQFLEEIDRYPIQVPVKGGFTTWKPRRIYITSIYKSEDFARVFNHPDEWHRRITTVIELPSI